MMRLEVKNVGENTVKSIVWEFQPTVQTAEPGAQTIHLQDQSEAEGEQSV
jgi:hypothetical protein